MAADTTGAPCPGAETLANLQTIHENAQTLSKIPDVELTRPPVERLRHLDAEVRRSVGAVCRSNSDWS